MTKREWEPYGVGWVALRLVVEPRPRGLSQWVRALWGWDIFFGPIPVVKMMVAANVIVWGVMVWTW